MPRLRTLKPGFFTNELLAEVDPLGRLLFQGLWCLADREGRLEDRPKRIKAEVLPYDDADADALLNALAAAGFIVRYAAAGGRYIQVVNFGKHQTPHIKEAASTIPPPAGEPASTVQAPCLPDENTVPAPPVIGNLVIGNLEPDLGEWEPGGTGGADAPAADAASRPIKPVPKSRESPGEFEPLRQSFLQRGLRAPPLAGGAEAQAARRLLKLAGDADLLAACFQDIRAGEYGDPYAQQHLSFVFLERQNRFENWRAWKEGEVGRPASGSGQQRRNGVGAQSGPPGSPSPFAKYGGA